MCASLYLLQRVCVWVFPGPIVPLHDAHLYLHRGLSCGAVEAVALDRRSRLLIWRSLNMAPDDHI